MSKSSLFRWKLKISSYKLTQAGEMNQDCREMTLDEHSFNKLLWYRQNCENVKPITPKTISLCSTIKTQVSYVVARRLIIKAASTSDKTKPKI